MDHYEAIYVGGSCPTKRVETDPGRSPAATVQGRFASLAGAFTPQGIRQLGAGGGRCPGWRRRAPGSSG